MAHSLSAQKRVRQNEKHRMQNKAIKSDLKSEVKKLLGLVHDKKSAEAKEQLVKVYKKLDQVSAKGVIHRNTAGRRKSRLAVRVAAIGQTASA